MAIAITHFVVLSLMFLESLSRVNSLINNEKNIEVTQSGSEFYIREGGSINLPCGVKTSTSAFLEHHWLKGQDRIRQHSRRNMNLDLYLENVSQENEGEYRCVVKTKTGILLGPIHTLINPVLTTDIPDEDIHIEGIFNQSVVLPCPINSVPKGEIRWTNVENFTLRNSRYKQLNSGYLLIRALRQDDGGEFHCVVKNRILNEEHQITVHLRISLNESDFEPVILDTFPNNVTLSSDTKKFYCIGNGKPFPTSTWIHTYDTLIEDPFISQPQTEHRSVSLGSVLWLNRENGSSRYDCVVSVGATQISKSMDTQIAPSFPNLPTLRHPAAKTVRFECKPTTYPIKWYKNGELLQTNSGRVKSRNNELVISNSLISDSGYYQCESSKYLGTGRLIIESPVEISPPTEIFCASSSSKSMEIYWKIRLDQNIQAFTVHFTPTEGGEENTKVTNNTSITLEPLKPKTNYSIYVRAYSGRSASGQSVRLFCSTIDDSLSPPVKITTPTSLQFHVLGNNSVKLTWEVTNTGNILLYAVEVTNTSNHKNESSLTYTNETSLILENLLENTNYFVRVLAETSTGGSGEYSSTIVFRISNNQSLNVTSSSNNSSKNGKETPDSSRRDSSNFLGSERSIGIIIGIVLAVACIVICGTILICRNRCFSYLLRFRQRSRRGSYVSTVTSGKDTVDSAPLEMKVITTHLGPLSQQHIDTKGGHPNGGVYDGATDPLVSNYRNNREGLDEEDKSSS